MSDTGRPPYSGDVPFLYDHVPLHGARRDVQLYVGLAQECRGRVLEVGCGTGRVLLPIARTGVEIDGLDASQAMLDRCAKALTAEPSEVQRRVRLHHGDAREFELGTKFDLVIAPFRVVQHLITLEEQLAFLTSVARHLHPGGVLAFDVFNPNFAALVAADGIEREDTPPTKLPDGRSFRRAARVRRVHWAEQVSEIELIYYLSNERDEEVERVVDEFEMRWYLKAELVHLLARCGFRPRSIYGDLDRSPFTDKSPEIIVVAELGAP